jgi:hypothetical protein
MLVEPAGALTGTGNPLERPVGRYRVPVGIPSETKLRRATVFELLIQTSVHSRSGRPESSKVLMPAGGSSRLGVLVEVAVGETVGVAVGVPVKMLVGVVVAVSVGVAVAAGVCDGVGVSVGVLVGVSTVKLAVEVLPLPPLAEVTVTILFLIPAVAPSTSIEKLQDSPAESVTPDSLTVEEPATASIDPPAQEPVSPLGVATRSPAGNVSVKATPVNAVTGSGLVIVKLRVVVSFNRILAAPKDLVIEGGSITRRVSVAAVLLVAPSLLISAPGGMVFR